MHVTVTPVKITWPKIHYVYIEKIGPFKETAPACWHELQALLPEFRSINKITNFLSLYKVFPEQVYRAGISVESKPTSLPDGLEYCEFEGGEYLQFIATGPYSGMPEACGIVFDIVQKTRVHIRDDFYIEHYLNDPKDTKESELMTGILIPI